MKNIIKKVIVMLIVTFMVMSMGAWTYEGASASKMEECLRSYGFVRTEDDDTIWVCDVTDYDASDFDYVIVHGTYWSEENLLAMTVIGIDIYRNLIVVVADGVGEWDPETEDLEGITEWAHDYYSY